jgi:predicted nuclease of restriction endonuclease-like (RecB) superfamily
VLPPGYASVLSEVKRMIGDSRRRALASVNRELVRLYWEIGRVIVAQQDKAAWGEAVVERLSADLRAEFPDMKGLMSANLWRMRQFFLSCREIDAWLQRTRLDGETRTVSGHDQLAARRGKGLVERPSPAVPEYPSKLAAAWRESAHPDASPILATLWRELSPEHGRLVLSVSWSHHRLVMGASGRPDERFFYLSMAVRERWSVRELERQIDSDLFTRYVSVKRDPERCLPAQAEQGDLLPFKDHYLLDFLGLEESHTERQLRRAMLANLRDLFLELGRDFTFVGEEYPVVAGDDTFRVDLLFFHRRLQCLVALELKAGKFKPEYVGKCQFYLAALDEQARLPHEKPSLGLILCKSANGVQMRLALTAAARKIGVATYQTALPEERLILRRLEQLPALTKDPDDNDHGDGS